MFNPLVCTVKVVTEYSEIDRARNKRTVAGMWERFSNTKVNEGLLVDAIKAIQSRIKLQ